MLRGWGWEGSPEGVPVTLGVEPEAGIGQYGQRPWGERHMPEEREGSRAAEYGLAWGRGWGSAWGAPDPEAEPPTCLPPETVLLLKLTALTHS